MVAVKLNTEKMEEAKAAPTSSFGVTIPDGTYKAVIVKSEEVAPIVSGDPKDLMLTVVITDGEHSGKELEVRLGFDNTKPMNPEKPGWTYQKAAYKNMAAILDALSIPQDVKDFNTTMLHAKPLLIVTGTGKPKPKANGNGNWPGRTYINDVLPIPKAGAVQATHQAVAAAATVPVQDSAVPPWEQTAA